MKNRIIGFLGIFAVIVFILAIIFLGVKMMNTEKIKYEGDNPYYISSSPKKIKPYLYITPLNPNYKAYTTQIQYANETIEYEKIGDKYYLPNRYHNQVERTRIFEDSGQFDEDLLEFVQTRFLDIENECNKYLKEIVDLPDRYRIYSFGTLGTKGVYVRLVYDGELKYFTELGIRVDEKGNVVINEDFHKKEHVEFALNQDMIVELIHVGIADDLEKIDKKLAELGYSFKDETSPINLHEEYNYGLWSVSPEHEKYGDIVEEIINWLKDKDANKIKKEALYIELDNKYTFNKIALNVSTMKKDFKSNNGLAKMSDSKAIEKLLNDEISDKVRDLSIYIQHYYLDDELGVIDTNICLFEKGVPYEYYDLAWGTGENKNEG